MSWDPSSYFCLTDMVSISANDVWLSLTRSCHCVWQVSRVLVTGPIVSASPLLSPGVRSPSPWCQECRTHGLTSSTLTTHRPHSLSANSIHLPTSQIRWQLSVCVNLRVIRTMKIFLSNQPTVRSDHQVYNWDHPLSILIILLHFLGFPQLSPALQ